FVLAQNAVKSRRTQGFDSPAIPPYSSLFPLKISLRQERAVMAIRVGVNGFGRIGRLFYRHALNTGGIEIVAVNDIVPADNLAYLLKHDTMQWKFMLKGEEAIICSTENSFSVNGQTTKTISEKDPAKLPWKDLGVQYVLESTGLFTDFEKASAHIIAGAKRVI